MWLAGYHDSTNAYIYNSQRRESDSINESSVVLNPNGAKCTVKYFWEFISKMIEIFI